MNHIRKQAEFRQMQAATALWIGIGPVTMLIMCAMQMYFCWTYGGGVFMGEMLLTPTTVLTICGVVSMGKVQAVPVETSDFGFDENYVHTVWRSYFHWQNIMFPSDFLKVYGASYIVSMAITCINHTVTDAVTITIFMNGLFLGVHLLLRTVIFLNIRRAIRMVDEFRHLSIFQM